MTVDASYLCESLTSPFGGWCCRSRNGRGKHPHEVGEGLDVRSDHRIRIGCGRGSSRKIKRVLRSGVELTAGRFVALLREKLVRDTHFDVVCLTRKHEKRFVLRLPAESGDGSIVCTE